MKPNFLKATMIKTEEEKTIVRLYNTDIVCFTKDNIKLNAVQDTGTDWHTYTTKQRMNDISKMFQLGYKVFQKGFIWYVNFRGKTFEYQDGMGLIRI